LFGRAQRALAALLVVVLALAATAVVAPPAAGEGDTDGGGNGAPINTAVVENTKDGSSVFKLAFQVRKIMESETVEPGNAAVAIASCTNCQTVAIAVQIVFVIGSPTVFAPENAAVAVNAGCSFCDTLATAYQFVVQSSVPVRFTQDGKQQLHDIYKALQDLEDSGLTAFELQAKVDELMKGLANILATQLEPIPGFEDGGQDADQSSTSSSSATTTTVTATSTTSTSTSTSTSSSTTTTTTTSTTTTTP
jgi:putative peptide zinc metalloprotease protein